MSENPLKKSRRETLRDIWQTHTARSSEFVVGGAAVTEHLAVLPICRVRVFVAAAGKDQGAASGAGAVDPVALIGVEKNGKARIIGLAPHAEAEGEPPPAWDDLLEKLPDLEALVNRQLELAGWPGRLKLPRGKTRRDG